MSSLGEERLAQLRAAKLVAVVRDHLHLEIVETSSYPHGASGRASDGRFVVLMDQPGPRSLGPALIWATKSGARRLDLIVATEPTEPTEPTGSPAEPVGPRLAREAALFHRPDIDVWGLSTAGLTAVEPAATPAPTPEPSSEAWLAAAVFADLGLDVVVEHGVIWGEVLGLGVACVTDTADGPSVDVGIGKFDREISAMMHADQPTADSIAAAADLVRRHRYPGAPTHPLRDLVPERWMRHKVLTDPAAVGATDLVPIDTTLRPTSLKERQPAAAWGHAADGSPLMVVCSAGVDLDLVPLAADTRAAAAPDARLVLVCPNALPATAVAVAGALSTPAAIEVIDPPWTA